MRLSRLGVLVTMAAGGWATAQAIEPELLAQIPTTAHVLMVLHPASWRQDPEIANLIHTSEQLANTWARQAPPTRVARVVVAFVPQGDRSQRLVLTLGKSNWSLEDFGSIQGAELRKAANGGASIHAHGTWPGNAVTLATPRCLVEGPFAILAALGTPSATHLGDIPADRPAAQLLAEPDAGWSAVLAYVAPETALDIHAMLQELDRTLAFGMEPMLGSYRNALRMLGSAHGLRVALRAQESSGYEAGLTIAMPNRMAAQIASVSLEAGAGMAQAASEAAVRAGKMSRADAVAMAAVLSTLRSRSDGDLVRVTVTMTDSAATAP